MVISLADLCARLNMVGWEIWEGLGWEAPDTNNGMHARRKTRAKARAKDNSRARRAQALLDAGFAEQEEAAEEQEGRASVGDIRPRGEARSKRRRVADEQPDLGGTLRGEGSARGQSRGDRPGSIAALHEQLEKKTAKRRTRETRADAEEREDGDSGGGEASQAAAPRVGEKRDREEDGTPDSRRAGSRKRLDPDEPRVPEGVSRPRGGGGEQTRDKVRKRLRRTCRIMYSDSEDE